MKPILFNTEMVKAILEGRKTSTRRITKFKPYTGINKSNGNFEIYEPITQNFFRCKDDFVKYVIAKCKYKVGDTLYVRETWTNTFLSDGIGFAYKADSAPPKALRWGNLRQGKAEVWIPSIHMPKSAARIFLKVTDIKVQQIQAIDADEVKREGFRCGYDEWLSTFKDYWDKLYKKKSYGWDNNPWVFVISFKRVDKEE